MAFKPEATRKTLNFIVLLDTSGSMGGDPKSSVPSRISMVNSAMKKLKTSLDDFAVKNKTIDVKIRVITFSSGNAKYHMGSRERALNLSEYRWVDIPNEKCDGDTPLGEAIDLVNELFDETNGRRKEALGGHISRPFLLLISDGAENGNVKSADALNRMMSTPTGPDCIRVSLALDIDDEDALKSLSNFGKGGCVKLRGGSEEVIKEVIEKITLTSLFTISSPKGNDPKVDANDINRKQLYASLKQELLARPVDGGEILELKYEG